MSAIFPVVLKRHGGRIDEQAEGASGASVGRQPGASVGRQPGGVSVNDTLVVEEPLEIRLDDTPLAVLMRTPGAGAAGAEDDLDLVAGFLRTEGLIEGLDDLSGLAHCTEPLRENAQNIVIARLAPGTRVDADRLRGAARSLVASAGCGLCGKTTLDSIVQAARPLAERWAPPIETLHTLTEMLRVAQPIYRLTGGCHGAGIFDEGGRPLCIREDIGRHNAVDKCIGALLRAGCEPPTRCTLVVSGRAGFELVQKAAMAGIPAMVSVGAASSLAHELAGRMGLRLFSFVRASSANDHG